MRTLIFILLLAPSLGFAQRTDVYIKLVDAKGEPMKGDGTSKSSINAILAATFTASGKNNEELIFTMPVCGTSADLKRAAITGEPLSGGTITAYIPNTGTGKYPTYYTVTLEKIRVRSCNEAMGSDKVSYVTVTLQPARIGWTYYDLSGQTVTGKFGWDTDTQSEWAKF